MIGKNYCQDRRNILWIVLISTFVRLIFPLVNFIFDRNYWFSDGSSPYFLKGDSFYYAGVLSNFGFNNITIYILPYLFTIATLIVFYLVCKKINIKYSFLATILLSLFPFFYDHSLIGYVDTPHFISLCIILLVYLYILFIENLTAKKYALSSFLMILLVFVPLMLREVWTGFPIVTLFFFVGVVFALCRKVWHYIIFGLASIHFIFIYITRFLKLVMFKVLGVAEYQPPLYFVYHIMFIWAVIMFFREKRDNVMRFLFGSALVYYVFSLFIGRFGAFAIIFIVLLFFKCIKGFNAKYIFWTIIIFNVIVIGLSYLYTTPLINRPYEQMLLKANEDIDIVSFWDNGHIIKYVTGSEYGYGNHPRSEGFVQRVCKGYSLPEDDAFIHLDKVRLTTPYYLVISSRDIKKIEWLGYNLSNDSILNKTYNNVPLDNFDLIGYSEYKNDKNWLYKRKVK
tara:strand:+ start:9677 stop:11038 length:1362 start_codon:yes stop_codon:yes gene_type:complete